MGSPNSEQDRVEDEGPQHLVTISKGFFLGKYEITQAQWMSVMGNDLEPNNRGSNLPMETISWNDVQEFIYRLNEAIGDSQYRLPTEAEWEHAAQAGEPEPTRWSFGDDESQLENYAWYSDNSNSSTQEVGTLLPNPWGLYDMHGNVWEWCQDWYGRNYYDSSQPEDPLGPSEPNIDTGRVNRGGSFLNSAQALRSARRNWFFPEKGTHVIGARLLKQTLE